MVFEYMVSLYNSLDGLRICSVDQASIEIAEICLPLCKKPGVGVLFIVYFI